jgi:hypothetical protein
LIKISTGIWADWLERPDDLNFLKQIGVDCVSFAFNIFACDAGTGCRLESDKVAQVVDKIDAANALNDVGYEGAIDYDHLMHLTNDGPLRREYVAYCVGHMRGILQGLDSNS